MRTPFTPAQRLFSRFLTNRKIALLSDDLAKLIEPRA
jgi:hypothetical protein